MPGRLAGIHVLVVDDDPDILAGIDLALRTEGATTETAADGASAIRAAAHRLPDLVVLDVMLPAASGFVVLEKIRAFADPPPVIMVTANQGRRHQTYAQTLGADAYFYKPVPLGKLIERAVELCFEEVPDDEAAAVERAPSPEADAKATSPRATESAEGKAPRSRRKPARKSGPTGESGETE
ncbi:MAG: response regulator [Phycisphaeraceae bacterium]|nr:response regulator [Phycisphaeraceae bacterium]